MTGRILALGSASRTGTIKTADGSRFGFTAAAVLGDFDALAIGHNVSFDIEHEGTRCRVTTVFREPATRTPVRSTRADAPPDLRYAGFQQAANVRTYRFEVLSPDHSTQHSIMLDMALLMKHRVGMQEVPALCAIKVVADLKTSPESVRHQLAEDDLRQFACSRAAALERRTPRHSFAGRRGTPPPGPTPKRAP